MRRPIAPQLSPLVDRPFGSRLLCAPKRTDGLRVAFWGFITLFCGITAIHDLSYEITEKREGFASTHTSIAPVTYRATAIRSRTTSRLSLVSFLLPTHLLRTTLGPDLRKRNSSPEHGVSRTTRREN